MITIIDYRMGNVGSISNMFRKLGVKSIISSNPEDIMKADGLILPGVGAFDVGISNLREMGLVEILERRVIQQKIPILGICLGMQLFTKSSEEGSQRGLGWVPARTVRFRPSGSHANLKIPHMGWNTVHPKEYSTLFRDMEKQEIRFYFVHSYHVECEDPSDVLGITNYGIEFTSALRHENIYGAQFHPEKSHKYGMQVLKNFAALECVKKC